MEKSTNKSLQAIEDENASANIGSSNDITAQQKADVTPESLEKGGAISPDNSEMDETRTTATEDTDTNGDEGDAQSEQVTTPIRKKKGVDKPFVKRIPIKKKLKNLRSLLDGGILYGAFYKGDLHITAIMRSVTTFDVDWIQSVMDFLMSKFSRVDAVLTEEEPFDVSGQYPGSTAKVVTSPMFTNSLKELITKVNGYRWIPHITFPSDTPIPKKVDGMELKFFIFKPNWNHTFDRSYVFNYLRIKKYLTPETSKLDKTSDEDKKQRETESSETPADPIEDRTTNEEGKENE
jgi:hypothetical protein